MLDDLIRQEVALPGGPLEVLQPREVADLPDDDAIEWAPIAPYWAVMWRSGVALAAEVARADVSGLRIVELGCGLGLPSLAAARTGAEVLATDVEEEALELLERNAAANGLAVRTAAVDWAHPDELVALAPFDLVLAADVFYEDTSVDRLAALLPRLAPEAWLADPGRPGARALLDGLNLRTEPNPAVTGPARTFRVAFTDDNPHRWADTGA